MALSARRKAEKRNVWFRGAVSGPAGSGKTLSALKVARGLVGPSGLITVIDTERNSSELYADAKRFPELGAFDVIEFTPPFTAAMYREAIHEAQKGSDAIIIDSLSHAWTGQGGMLEAHGRAVDASRSKNSWEAWRHVTPDHDRLVDDMLACGCHLFVTLRTKTEWVLEKDQDGRNKPVKIGLEPRFREGIDYEFTVVWDIRQEDHYASASKDRTALFVGFNDILSVRHGEMIREWSEDGQEAVKPESQPNRTADRRKKKWEEWLVTAASVLSTATTEEEAHNLLAKDTVMKALETLHKGTEDEDRETASFFADIKDRFDDLVSDTLERVAKRPDAFEEAMQMASEP